MTDGGKYSCFLDVVVFFLLASFFFASSGGKLAPWLGNMTNEK